MLMYIICKCKMIPRPYLVRLTRYIGYKFLKYVTRCNNLIIFLFPKNESKLFLHKIPSMCNISVKLPAFYCVSSTTKLKMRLMWTPSDYFFKWIWWWYLCTPNFIEIFPCCCILMSRIWIMGFHNASMMFYVI